MKTKNILVLTIIYLLSFSSCSDSFLEDMDNSNNFSENYVFNDPEQANAIFASFYKGFLGSYRSPMYGSDPLMRHNNVASFSGNGEGGKNYELTEEIAIQNTGDKRLNIRAGINDIARGNFIGGDHYWNAGLSNLNKPRSTVYARVYQLNQFIKDIDVTGRKAYNDETFWNRLQGQAIFLRAWLYFDALRLWGGVPYYTTETDIPAADDRSPRLSVDETVEKVVADFERAASLLPDKWENGATDYGRFTRVAALAMISRVRLYAASPIFNASWENGTRRWDAALKASLEAKDAADQAGYGTSISSIQTWDETFYAYDGGTFNPEAIIVVPTTNNELTGTTGILLNDWEKAIRPAILDGDGVGYPAPKQMLDLFPLANGKRPSSENGYNEELFFLDRDPRFYRTFAFSGCSWQSSSDSKTIWLYGYKSGDDKYNYTDGSTNNPITGKSKALVWKMSNPKASNSRPDLGGADILEYRYAELILNIAECYAAKGDVSNCTKYLNIIRSRVGAGNIPAISDKYKAIEAVLYERRIELAYEGKRAWDTRRWLLYEGGAGFHIANDGNIDPKTAHGQGWKLYKEYTAASNVCTKLGVEPISGMKHISEIWGYDLVNTTIGNDPFIDNSEKKAIDNDPIKRTDSEDVKKAKLNKLKTFYQNNLATVNLNKDDILFSGYDGKYGMDYVSKYPNFGIMFRGWYYIYPIHYNIYIIENANTWIAQNAGWNIDNSSSVGLVQDGTYIYCTPE